MVTSILHCHPQLPVAGKSGAPRRISGSAAISDASRRKSSKTSSQHCTDKNDAVVRYTLGKEQQKKTFTSRYKLHLPSEAEFKAELLRELKSIKP
jgi:hypothetical protein